LFFLRLCGFDFAAIMQRDLASSPLVAWVLAWIPVFVLLGMNCGSLHPIDFFVIVQCLIHFVVYLIVTMFLVPLICRRNIARKCRADS
jgi:membrane protein YdbS with pleckstrin-like domain